MTGVTVSNCSEQVPKEWESKGRCLKSSNWSPRCVAVQVFLGLQTLRFMEPAACFEDMPRYAPICSLIPTSWTHNSSCLWVEKKLLLLRGPPPAANSERWSCSGWSYHVLSFSFLVDLGRLQCTSAIGPAVESSGTGICMGYPFPRPMESLRPPDSDVAVHFEAGCATGYDLCCLQYFSEIQTYSDLVCL
jgi:hypothetical protein